MYENAEKICSVNRVRGIEMIIMLNNLVYNTKDLKVFIIF